MLYRYFFLFLCWLSYVRVIYASNFDDDYFFGLGRSSHTEFRACENRRFLYLCHQKCGRNHICYNGQCMCYDAVPIIELSSKEDLKGPLYISDEFVDLTRIKPILEQTAKTAYTSDEFVDITRKKKKIERTEKTGHSSDEFVDVTGKKKKTKPKMKAFKRSYPQKPALRHHIAHFCPDLDIARECIKKCMAEGKPAFCGKDHKCYCGHSYSYTDKDDPNVHETFNEFRDMYAKYFGEGHSPASIH